ncbi:hypothetical protein LTR86_010187 [Recurvomyces mirabilis]|nr:hypothetical protein LTR86_010187 [Recurvomyces mirabilis]
MRNTPKLPVQKEGQLDGRAEVFSAVLHYLLTWTRMMTPAYAAAEEWHAYGGRLRALRDLHSTSLSQQAFMVCEQMAAEDVKRDGKRQGGETARSVEKGKAGGVLLR